MLLIKIAICFSYFIIGGLATTNMLRLLKGETKHVYSSQCSCTNCGMKIGFFNQMPIVSYIASKGKCRQCGIPIPVDALILEIVVFVGMSVISIIGKFSLVSVVFSFVYFEVVRIVLFIKNGHREKDFIKQYFFAILAMVFLLLIVEFMAVILLYLTTAS